MSGQSATQEAIMEEGDGDYSAEIDPGSARISLLLDYVLAWTFCHKNPFHVSQWRLLATPGAQFLLCL